MSATIKEGSERTICNQDKQRSMMAYQESTDTLQNVRVESNGALPVNIQDQHTRAFGLHFAQDIGSPTILIADTVVDAYSISVATGHGYGIGDYLRLTDPVTNRGFTAEVLSVVGDNTINLDRPLDRALSAASTVVQERTIDMNVDGSGTRQTFAIGGVALTAELDITRIMFQMTTTAQPTLAQFGDQTALTRGLVFRLKNGTRENIWNVKTNGDLALLMYDVDVWDSEKAFQVNGLAGRLTYAGQSKHGVTLRIGQNEQLEMIVQDDLRLLLSFRIMAEGHIVTD